jgi:hypothetical protein
MNDTNNTIYISEVDTNQNIIHLNLDNVEPITGFGFKIIGLNIKKIIDSDRIKQYNLQTNPMGHSLVGLLLDTNNPLPPGKGHLLDIELEGNVPLFYPQCKHNIITKGNSNFFIMKVDRSYANFIMKFDTQHILKELEKRKNLVNDTKHLVNDTKIIL